MTIKEFKKLDIKVYEEVLENGLRIFIAPLKRNSISASYVSLFGGRDLNFIPNNKKEMYYCPPGVAHFLEHKMFDKKNGQNVFDFFEKTGTYCNAYTYKETTRYIFEGPSHFEENLNFLLDYVNTPTFTTKTIEKEKPIILEEAKANFDLPVNMAFDTAMKNVFCEDGYMYPIIGTYDSIKSTTKEDLSNCYNTFYHPSNMILVISGNVDPEKTIDLVKENFSKRKFLPINIVKEEINEPDTVNKDFEIVNMPITNEIFYLAYKINISDFNISRPSILNYLGLVFILKLGNLSKFNDEGLRSGELLGQLAIDPLIVGKHIILGIYGEVRDALKTVDKIKNELVDLTVAKEDLELIKKTTLSNLILMNEQPSGVNSRIVSDVSNYGNVRYDIYEKIKNINCEEYNEFIKKLDLSNNTLTIVKNNQKKSWFLTLFMIN